MQLLPVMEHFYTIQGEGYYQGYAAYFVRLGGCDVGCTWCDVKESWDAKAHPTYSVNEIVAWIKESGAKICVVTGGEPLMHNLDQLTTQIQSIGVRTHIETSGAYPISGTWDWICVSPKRFKLPLTTVLKSAHELKVVIAHRNDLRFADSFLNDVSKDCMCFLQPEWKLRNEMHQLIIDFVKEHQRWVMTLQMHKYINVP